LARIAAAAVLRIGTIGAQVAVPASRNSISSPQKPSQPAAAPKSCALRDIPAQRIQEVVDASYALQPPLAADAMIRVANKVASGCPALAKDLLQRGFDQSEKVEPETSQKLVSGMALTTDSALFLRNRAYALGMDRLSLQSRAVIGMVPVDGARAIELFQRIAKPRLLAASCDSALAPEVSIYYEALGKVYALMKAGKARNGNEAQAPFLLMQEIASAITSPVQLEPLAKVLQDSHLRGVELSSILSALATVVENFPLDDNSFYDRNKYSSVDAEVALSQLAFEKEVSQQVFTHSFHDYLNRSLNGPHCEGNEPTNLRELILLYQSFNRRAGASEPLTLPTTMPAVDPSPDAGDYWLTPKTKLLLVDAKHTNFDDNWKAFTAADRETPEWQDRVRHLLDDMEDWRPSDEVDPVAYYHQRCILITRLLSELPTGSLYGRVVGIWINTLAESSLQWDNPAEWYLGVSDYLNFSKKDSKGKTPEAVTISLKNSSNPYLHSIGIVAEFLQ
jgi:hypothetical protein